MARAEMPDNPRRTTQRLYFISLGLYAVSFALPAVINPHPTPYFGWVEMWGWQAAILSIATPMVVVLGPSNAGYVAAAVLIAIGYRRAAIASAGIALASMAACGIMLPPQPGGGPIRWPGGHLGPAYYAWLAAGIIMLVCGVRAHREAPNPHTPTLGLTDLRK